jgi:ankyrin repeat protein
MVLSAGADPNDGIEAAVSGGNLAIVETLLNAGVDPTAIGSENRAIAMELAILNGNVALIRLLEDSGLEFDLTNRLIGAAIGSRIAVVEALLEYGVSADTRTRTGMPLLMSAVNSFKSDIAQALLEHGADPNAQQTTTDLTALIVAARNSQVDMVKLLLSFGASTEIHDRTGRRAIDVTSSEEIRLILIESGAAE